MAEDLTSLAALDLRITVAYQNLQRAREKCNRCPTASNLRTETDRETAVNQLLEERHLLRVADAIVDA